MEIRDLSKYFYTVRYLRLKQIFYQLYYRYYSVTPKSLVSLSLQLRKWLCPWVSPTTSITQLMDTGEMTFIGESAKPFEVSIWNDPNRSKLWLYHLHYFDVLNTVQADIHVDKLVNLFERWRNENPPCEGIAWEPYPLSLRIVNLIKWFSRQPDVVRAEWLPNLEMQINALYQQIEYHILGNHLFVNGKALVFAGTYFEGPHADRWLEKGLKILDREIEEQFLDDGGHFELSPMYHSILLWDMCDLLNLARRSRLPILLQRQHLWTSVIKKALVWLDLMLHPDGKLSFFNDAAFGIAPEYQALVIYAQKLGIFLPEKPDSAASIVSYWLKNSGYCVISLGNAGKAILDIAEIGPVYQPGHAHADSLSFELSLYGQRFFVNTGTSTYAQGIQRESERGTLAHNTVSIDKLNSSEVWSAFRVARRARPQDLIIDQQEQCVTIGCSHDGYMRLAGRNIHRREWRFSDKELMLRDTISGQYKVAESRLYLHPDIQIESVEKEAVRCRLVCGQIVVVKVMGAEQVRLEQANWHPTFGVGLVNYCLIATFTGEELLTFVHWGGVI